MHPTKRNILSSMTCVTCKMWLKTMSVIHSKQQLVIALVLQGWTLVILLWAQHWTNLVKTQSFEQQCMPFVNQKMVSKWTTMCLLVWQIDNEPWFSRDQMASPGMMTKLSEIKRDKLVVSKRVINWHYRVQYLSNKLNNFDSLFKMFLHRNIVHIYLARLTSLGKRIKQWNNLSTMLTIWKSMEDVGKQLCEWYMDIWNLGICVVVNTRTWKFTGTLMTWWMRQLDKHMSRT